MVSKGMGELVPCLRECRNLLCNKVAFLCKDEILHLSFSADRGGVIYSRGDDSDINVLFSTQSLFEGNSGGIFYLRTQNNLASEKNVYVNNRAQKGSVIYAESIFINVNLSGDRIWNNTSNLATIHAG